MPSLALRPSLDRLRMLEAEVVALTERALALELVACRTRAQPLQRHVCAGRAVLLLLLLVERVIRRG